MKLIRVECFRQGVMYRSYRFGTIADAVRFIGETDICHLGTKYLLISNG